LTPHGTLMSVGLHYGDAGQVYVVARYGEVFGTQGSGESWLECRCRKSMQHIYSLACGWCAEYLVVMRLDVEIAMPKSVFKAAPPPKPKPPPPRPPRPPPPPPGP
jgi:hypothetical protein